MKECFEIAVKPCDLHETRDNSRVRYTLNDGDTIIMVSTSDPTMTEGLAVSKFRNARVEVVITVDHDDMEYKGIQP
jgi:hypothetical protein